MSVFVKTLVLFVTIVSVNVKGNTKTQGNFNVYHLYTRQQSRISLVVQPTNAAVKSAPILRTRNTVIIIHGHLGDKNNYFGTVLKDAFLTSEDLNIIVVDWRLYASQAYSTASTAVPNIGLSLATFIQLLISNHKAELSRIHVIGFGLGAHVAGFSGRTLANPVARITGLDPAAEGWENSLERIRASDAHYVEVIHTDTLGPGATGLQPPTGHVDFYVNGGGNQPGCAEHLCSHDRAWELFAASLTSNHLIGRMCTNINQLAARCTGYIAPFGKNDFVKYASGIFGVETGCIFPYDDQCNEDSSDSGSGEDIFLL